MDSSIDTYDSDSCKNKSPDQTPVKSQPEPMNHVANFTEHASDCRYCMTTVNTTNDCFKPCLCKSSIHRKCLEKWLDSKSPDNRVRCEICLYRFDTESYTEYNSCTTICQSTKIIVKYWIGIPVMILIYGFGPVTIAFGHTIIDMFNHNIILSKSNALGYEGSHVEGWVGLCIAVITISIISGMMWCISCIINNDTDEYGRPRQRDMQEIRDTIFIFVGMLTIGSLIATCIIQAIGLGYYNLVEHGDMLYTFYPRFRTFGVGILVVTVIVAIIASIVISILAIYCYCADNLKKSKVQKQRIGNAVHV